MINYIENENDNVKQTIYFNRPRRRNGHQYTKYNMSRLDDVYMSQVTFKQHLKLNSLKKLCNTEAELKKHVAYKKVCTTNKKRNAEFRKQKQLLGI